jgi:hypothetical protein
MPHFSIGVVYSKKFKPILPKIGRAGRILPISPSALSPLQKPEEKNLHYS